MLFNLSTPILQQLIPNNLKSSQGSFVERPPCGIQVQAITMVITFLIFYVLWTKQLDWNW